MELSIQTQNFRSYLMCNNKVGIPASQFQRRQNRISSYYLKNKSTTLQQDN